MKKALLFMCVGMVMSAIAMAGDYVLPNRMADVKVGEWVILSETSGPSMGDRERFTVVEIKGEDEFKTVVVRRERIADDGSVTEQNDLEINLARFQDRLHEMEDKAKQVSRERMVVDNRDLALWSVSWERENEDGEMHEYKMWVSEDLPVGGLYKTWSSDPNFPALELMDCGF